MAKLGFELEITELRLGLPGDNYEKTNKNKKRVFSCEMGPTGDGGAMRKKPVLVVGWPPVCSYRRRGIDVASGDNKKMVKISMDGVPFLRKVNLNDFVDYSHLLAAVDNLFECSTIGEALKGREHSEYVPIYEDKEGDWLLVGDVPWEMFVESCRRLRIMKSLDAKGLDRFAIKK